MAGTLVITTLSDGTNSTSATNPILGSAKAWVNWNGSTAGIRASYNVSSITKSSTGVYLVNFTNAFSDANYSSVATTSDLPLQQNATANTTTQASISSMNLAGTRVDSTYISAVFNR